MADPTLNKTQRKWEKRKIALLVLVVLLVGFAARWQIGLSMARSDWQNLREKVHTDGYPVTFEQLEEIREDVPPDRNSALVIEDLYDELDAIEDRGRVLFFEEEKERGRLSGTAVRKEVDAQCYFQSKAFLEQHREIADALTRLSSRPTGRPRESYLACKGNPYSTSGTPLVPYRKAAKLLWLQTLLRFVEEDSGGALESSHLIFQVAGALDNEWMIVHHLVQQSILAMGVDSLEATLSAGQCDADQLGMMQDLLRFRIERLNPQKGLSGELLHQVAVFDQMVIEKDLLKNVHSFDDLSYVFTRDLSVWQAEETLRESQIVMTENLYPMLEAAADCQWVTLRDESRKLETRIDQMQDVRLRFNPWNEYVYPSTNSSSFQRTVEQFLMLRGRMLSAETAMAVERFRIATGSFPDSLDLLVPDYIAEIPVDPFNEEPLRYIRTDEGVVVYSVNHNVQDDGGAIDPIWVEKEKRHKWPLDTGFRLLNPEVRGVRIVEPPQQDENEE